MISPWTVAGVCLAIGFGALLIGGSTGSMLLGTAAFGTALVFLY